VRADRCIVCVAILLAVLASLTLAEVIVEQDEKPRLPAVMYANLVSFNLTTDDMLLEFWEHRPGHATPPTPAEEVVKTKLPVARIVVPFASAKWLRDQLDLAVPNQENNRKVGQ
jgi:hypothetical protein